jgi:hypothetical protein
MVISEAALYQGIGGRETTRGQLAHLLSSEGNPRINVQVLPFSAGAHAGLTGSFTLFRFASDPTIVYTEGYGRGIRPRTRTPSRTVHSVTITSGPAPLHPSRTRRS